MRKFLLLVPFMAISLGGCNGDISAFSVFSAFVKIYCGVEPSIDDWARLRFPDQQITENILDAAAKAFCRQARAQSSLSFAPTTAREKVVRFHFRGHAATVRYTGTLR